MNVFASSIKQSFPAGMQVRVQSTLALGRLRVPFKVLGSARAFALHDAIVSRRLRGLAPQIDIVHVWPMGALRTLRTARDLGIPTVLERPNAHTRFAYEVVQMECERLGVALPAGQEHAYKPSFLRIEEEEYNFADALLCPSDFVVRTFLDKGFEAKKLVRHTYGFDEKMYHPDPDMQRSGKGLKMLFVGVCAVRKGIHFALDAWLRSPASEKGTFLIAGEFLPAYADKLRQQLSHPSVRVLGHRKDVPELMRACDVFVLPTIEEGSALVTYEARGSGCVLLVSEAAGAVCEHLKTGLVHRAGDVATLTEQITMLDRDRTLLGGLRRASLTTAGEVTWTASGARLLQAYSEVIGAHKRKRAARGGTEKARDEEASRA
jgi:glycosyltransferase involved in cell wall biosynthesis